MKFILIIILLSSLIGCTDKKSLSIRNTDNSKKNQTVFNNDVLPVTKPDDLPLDTLLKSSNNFVISSIPVTGIINSIEDEQLSLLGNVIFDNKVSGIISSKIEGRINKLYIKYNYQHIYKGQKIFDIYSPELLTSEENYLYLLQNDPLNTSMIQAAKERLLLEGMTKKQLTEIASTKKPQLNVSVYSDNDGIVTDVNTTQVNNSSNNSANNTATNLFTKDESLQVKEGMYLQKGQNIFLVLSTNNVIISLNIYPNQANIIRRGNLVDIVAETDSGKIIKGRIDYIDPVITSQSKTITARVYFNNNNLKLPIGSTVKAIVHANSQRGSWLPVSSVISTGKRNIVFTKIGGGFIAHQIFVGKRTTDKIEILSGLQSKDSVALNAQQLFSSEGNINMQ